jgi:hypothetical protein
MRVDVGHGLPERCIELKLRPAFPPYPAESRVNNRIVFGNVNTVCRRNVVWMNTERTAG